MADDSPSTVAAPKLLSRLPDADRGLVLFDLLEERRHAHGTGKSEQDLNDFVEWAMPRTGPAKAQLFQDLWVLWELGEKTGGYFCEFGATDGVDLSNTFLLEKSYGWTGALAEPNPIYHQPLAAARDCHVSHKCVLGQSGRTMRFNCTKLPQLSRLDAIAPDDGHERLGRRKIERVIEVETISLDDLLDEAGAPDHIDYISVDTEGSELDILEHFDFGRRSVTLFSVEHNRTPQRDRIHGLLTAQGYVRRFVEFTRFDDWYIRPDLA